jgi:predicted HAD superfamily Cof-like phosphohydrolase
VRYFHEAFGLPIKDTPTIPDLARVELRRRLIEEEFREVIEEFERISTRLRSGRYIDARTVYLDIGRLAKELSDLRYVVEGCALEFGIPLDDVYAEVHRSNMSKLGEDGKPVRRHDGKVLKGPNYREADPLAAMNIYLEGTTSP